MLLKISELTLRYSGDYLDDAGGVTTIEHSVETWINPERVSVVHLNPRYYEGFAYVRVGTQQMTVSLEDARRVIDHINLTEPSPTEKQLHDQLEREIEQMNRAFSQPESSAK